MKFLAVDNGCYGYGATTAEAEKNLKSAGGDVNLATIYSVPDTHQMVPPNPPTNTKTPLAVATDFKTYPVVSKPKTAR